MTPDPAEPEDRSLRPDGDGEAGILRRVRSFWDRHRTLFWMVHSGWALATGIVVVFLARERYGLVPWVVLFLALTWASTLFFGGRSRSDEEQGGQGATPGVGEEVTSYVTRTLYQETLFFLLPLYAHSTIPGSANVGFLALLAGLALFSCLDLVFDRWLRTRPLFGLLFFTTVAFAAINLLLPLLLGVEPRFATPAAALVALGTSAPLALRTRTSGRSGHLRIGVAAVILLVVAVGIPELVPPVPLRLQEATFSTGIDRETLEQPDTLGPTASPGEVGDAVFVVLEVFAPASVPARVRLEWRRNGAVVRTSREVEIVAHEAGFRVWDAWDPGAGPVPEGRYAVVLRTAQGRVFGRAEIEMDRTGSP